MEIKKKTDSLSTASLVGVKVRNEFIYPLEGFFTSYLSDHLDDDVSVLDSDHPFPIPIIPRISTIMEIWQAISTIMEIYPPAARRQSYYGMIICIRIQKGR